MAAVVVVHLMRCVSERAAIVVVHEQRACSDRAVQHWCTSKASGLKLAPQYTPQAREQPSSARNQAHKGPPTSHVVPHTGPPPPSLSPLAAGLQCTIFEAAPWTCRCAASGPQSPAACCWPTAATPTRPRSSSCTQGHRVQISAWFVLVYTKRTQLV